MYDRFLVRGRDPIHRAAYQHVLELSWDECQTCYADSPSTKAEHCLRGVFKLQPIRELCRYELAIGDDAWAAARSYLQTICPAGAGADGRYPAVLLHYQGNTSCEKKDLSHELARRVCETAADAGFVPVILDWDRRSPLPDGAGIFCPDADHPLWAGSGTGDCERLAALIAQSALFVGIDSGPLHVAGSFLPHFRERGSGAMEDGPPGPSSNLNDGLGRPSSGPTPALAVWTGHHPLHYFGLADHVTHLVPANHASRLRGDRATGQAFFERHYRHHVYQDLAAELPALVASALTGEPFERTRNKEFLRALRATGYAESYYQEHKAAGLDYLAYGDWQRQYGRWLVESLDLKGKRLLDVGCAAAGSVEEGPRMLAQGDDFCQGKPAAGGLGGDRAGGAASWKCHREKIFGARRLTTVFEMLG